MKLGRILLLPAVVALVSFVSAGCAHVKPWERGHLAKLEQHVARCGSARGYEAHMWMVREGPMGGRTVLSRLFSRTIRVICSRLKKISANRAPFLPEKLLSRMD